MENEKEIRLAVLSENFHIELRDAEGEDKDNNEMIIEGYAAVYDKETLIGDEEYGFYERISSGAFDGSDMKDVPLKYNHESAVPILARTRNGSLTLTTDDKGLKVSAKLIDTQDNIDMYKRIKAGLIDKMSFAFTITDDDFTQDERGVYHRVINKFDRIFDVSVVDIPAYDDTSIFARSLEKVETLKNTLENEKMQRINALRKRNQNKFLLMEVRNEQH